MPTAPIQLELSLDTTPFATALAKVRNLAENVGSEISKSWEVLSSAGASAFSKVAEGANGVKRVIEGVGSGISAAWPTVAEAGKFAFDELKEGAEQFKKALELGGELADLSAQTGVAAGQLLVLEQAFKNSGMAAGDVGPSITKMQSAVSDGSDAFQRMGVDLGKLQGMSASEQLSTIGAAINDIADPTQRSAAAIEVFGDSGAKMLSLFADSGALGTAAKEVGTQAELLNNDASLFGDVAGKLEAIGGKTMGFFVGVADKVAPVLEPLLDSLVSLDLAKYGQAIGEGIAFVVQALADGKLGAILLDVTKIAFAEAVNFLVAGLAGAGAALGQLMLESVKNAVELFQIVTTFDFWKGVADAWIGIAKGFYAVLFEGIAQLLEKLKDVPLIGSKIGDSAEVLRGAATGLRESGKADEHQAANLLAPTFERLESRLGEATKNVGAAAAKGFTDSYGLIDTSAWKKDMGNLVGQVMVDVKKTTAQARESVKEPPRTGVFDKATANPRTFADADRRVGLGGRAYATQADPLIKAHQETKRALDNNAAQTQKLHDTLSKEPNTIVKPLVPLFR